MLIYTYVNSTTINKRPIDQITDSYVPSAGSPPVAKYYRKTLNCEEGCSSNIARVYSVIDCNACRVTRNANTSINSEFKNGTKNTKYYPSTSEYLKAKCKTYDQGLVSYGRTEGSSSITKACCDDTNNCGVYKRSNEKYATQGAVSSGTRIMRLKYENIQKSI